MQLRKAVADLKIANERLYKQVVDLATEAERLKTSLKKYAAYIKKDRAEANRTVPDGEVGKDSMQEALMLENNKLRRLCDDKAKEITELLKQNNELKLAGSKKNSDASNTELDKIKKMHEAERMKGTLLKDKIELQLIEAKRTIKTNNAESMQTTKKLNENIEVLRAENDRLRVLLEEARKSIADLASKQKLPPEEVKNKKQEGEKALNEVASIYNNAKKAIEGKVAQ